MSSHNDETQVRVYFCRNAAEGGEIPAALSKLEVREDIVLEPVPCGGRIDPRYLLKAVESGAEAVCVLTCAHGHCKLIEGNLRAARRIEAVRELIAEAGVDPDTVQLFLPETDGQRAVEAAAERLAKFVDRRHGRARKVAVA
ncbi:MAG: hypothetical protein A2Z18_00800 [Armatimonadetes bacterium RBG_16_58_9]|nr:MAG: hypothetical protein A2Z18_00800 [Armatimonadetes bacterium RBG_16_58_9]